MKHIDTIPKTRRELNFECKKCGCCCRAQRQDFTVYLYYIDILNGAKAKELSVDKFLVNYCTPVTEDFHFLDEEITSKRFELKQHESKCIFLQNKLCEIYYNRPFICRYGPFLIGMLSRDKNWKCFSGICKGLRTGKKYSENIIESILRKESSMEKKYLKDFNKYKIFRKYFNSGGPVQLIHRKLFIDCTLNDYLSRVDAPQPRIEEARCMVL
ncbi:MAG: YkgJ family cysteine cluster protein [bacterium]